MGTSSEANLSRFKHLGSPPDNGNTPGDSDTTMLDGAYRMSPGSDTFWGPRYRAQIEDPPEIEA